MEAIQSLSNRSPGNVAPTVRKVKVKFACTIHLCQARFGQLKLKLSYQFEAEITQQIT